MDRHFSAFDLLKYTLPAIGTMAFTSLYGIVDGFFVSNWAGEIAFAGVNFVMPIIMMLSMVGFMFGAGGSALVGKQLGEQNDEQACRSFSLIVATVVIIGIVFSLFGAAVSAPLVAFLGATGEMYDVSVLYLRMSMISLVGFMLQCAFNVLWVTANKPKYGFRVTVAAGFLNIILDALLVGFVGWGVFGAALATIASEFVAGLIPLFYFLRKDNSSSLHFVSPFLNTEGRRIIQWGMLVKAASNGVSELVNHFATSLVAMVYNWQLLRLVGEQGVAAYGVIMYIWMVFGAALLGYAMGSSPIMSYNYGAQNRPEMRSLLKKSLVLLMCLGAVMMIVAQIFASPLILVFTSYSVDFYTFTLHAFRVYAVVFLFSGVSFFGSALFTALNNGLVSAIISFVRVFIFELSAVLILPIFLGSDGIWLAVTVADIAADIMILICVTKFYKRYFADVEPDAEPAA